MELKIWSLAERPEARERIAEMPHSWAEFVINDAVGDAHYPRIAAELPEFVLFAEDETGEVVAHAHSVPFALAAEGRGHLPARGWDEVLVWAFSDLRRGVRPDTVSAISVTVAPHAQGRGLSGRMLSAMRENARAHGFGEVVAPVRPSAKHLEVRTPIEEYAHRVRPDGLPHDPWLRVHARAGCRHRLHRPGVHDRHRLAGAVARLDGPALRHHAATSRCRAPWCRCGANRSRGTPYMSSPTCGCGTRCEGAALAWRGAGTGARAGVRTGAWAGVGTGRYDNGSVQRGPVVGVGLYARTEQSRHRRRARARRRRRSRTPHFRHQEQSCMATATRSR